MHSADVGGARERTRWCAHLPGRVRSEGVCRRAPVSAPQRAPRLARDWLQTRIVPGRNRVFLPCIRYNMHRIQYVTTREPRRTKKAVEVRMPRSGGRAGGGKAGNASTISKDAAGEMVSRCVCERVAQSWPCISQLSTAGKPGAYSGLHELHSALPRPSFSALLWVLPWLFGQRLLSTGEEASPPMLV